MRIARNWPELHKARQAARLKEQSAERQLAVEHALAAIASMAPELEDSFCAKLALMTLYDRAFGAGQQDEYSYPS